MLQRVNLGVNVNVTELLEGYFRSECYRAVRGLLCQLVVKIH